MTTNPMSKKTKVIAAMSGGVDSSVAAALLHQAGCDVIGVTLRLLDRIDPGFGCCGSPEDIGIAKRSAEKIGIPHYVLDYSQSFKENVIDYFFDSYTRGETPNPCLACNRHIKFDKLFKFARSLQGDFLATGHYARIVREADGRFHLLRARDTAKDQSYVLYTLDQECLAQALFPLGHLPKSKTREIARSLGLPNADKPDSQDICFIPDGNYKNFLKREGAERQTSKGMESGPIKDTAGRVLGEHQGVAFYTVGQREGLGLSAGKPLYVTKIDAPTKTLVVGEAGETLTREALVDDVQWVGGRLPEFPLRALIQIRYKHRPVPIQILSQTPQGLAVHFESPQRAVTKGQAAVFYGCPESGNADEVLGGGIIR
jgi:tRNA-specific 2-thiouridylase